MSFDAITDDTKKRAALDAVDAVNRYLGSTPVTDASDDYAQAFAAFMLAAVVGAYPPTQQAHVKEAIANNVELLLVDSNDRIWKRPQ